MSLGYEGGLAPRVLHDVWAVGICYYGCPSGGKNSMNLNYTTRQRTIQPYKRKYCR